MGRVILLSPHFPPSSLAGVHRARLLATHLPRHGWRPIVLRVDERWYTETNDPALAALVPPTVEQIRVGAIPAPVARLAGFGDIGLRGYFALRTALGQLAAREKPDVLFITGAPFFPMTLARYAREKLDIPVVLDFQDPWVSAEGAKKPPLSKAGLAHRMATVLEPRVVHYADFITSVSVRQNDEMAARYPWVDRARMAAIPIGGDPDDFVALRAAPARTPLIDPSFINLSYVGTFMPRSEPTMRVLLAAFARARIDAPNAMARVRLNFVGTSNQPGINDLFRVRPLAEAAGVADAVSEIPARTPYLDALSILARSDGLLLIGSDEAHYTGSKIYPALMSERPYLSLYHRASSSHDILAKAGGGLSFAFVDRTELEALVPALANAFLRLVVNGRDFEAAGRSAYGNYCADSIAAKFAAIFDRVAKIPSHPMIAREAESAA